MLFLYAVFDAVQAFLRIEQIKTLKNVLSLESAPKHDKSCSILVSSCAVVA